MVKSLIMNEMNLFDTSYVSLKKWHYEKNLHTTASFLLFFLEIYFFKNEFIQSQTKKKEEKKNLPRILFFLRNSPPLIKVEILY